MYNLFYIKNSIQIIPNDAQLFRPKLKAIRLQGHFLFFNKNYIYFLKIFPVNLDLGHISGK